VVVMRVSPCAAQIHRGPAVRGRIRAVLVVLSVATLSIVPRGGGAEPVESPPDPRVPQVSLDALPLGVPLARLDDAARGRAQAVLGSSVFSHRVTGLQAKSREPVFRFLLDHPDFAAAVTRALRLGQYHVDRRDDGYWGDDSRGARGMIRVLYADEGRRLLHLEGTYEGRGLPTIQGRMLVLLEFQHDEDPTGGTRVEASVTGHVTLDTPLVGAVAQLAATLARPTVERAVERKVRRFFATVTRVSRWAYDQPDQLWAALEAHPDVPQDATLAAFRDILLAGRPPAWAGDGYRLLPPEADDVEPDEGEPTRP
jgi:hypothetical protein